MNKTQEVDAEVKPADEMRNLVVTVSKSIANQLTADEICKVFVGVLDKMQEPSPKGNVWEFEAAGHKTRAILNEGCMLPGEDFVWLIMSEDDEWNTGVPPIRRSLKKLKGGDVR